MTRKNQEEADKVKNNNEQNNSLMKEGKQNLNNITIISTRVHKFSGKHYTYRWHNRKD